MSLSSGNAAKSATMTTMSGMMNAAMSSGTTGAKVETSNSNTNNNNHNSNTNTNNTKTSSSSSTTTTTTTSKKSNSSSVSTKPVHPMAITSFAPTGCEFSTWAYLTSPRPPSNTNTSINTLSQINTNKPPDLVTAHANSLKIYTVDPCSGKLLLASTYDNLAGTIVTLVTLPRAAAISKSNPSSSSTHPSNQSNSNSNSNSNSTPGSDHYDGLLLGFAGHPRLSIIYPPNIHTHSWNGVLSASTIIDLTPALSERCWGSVTPLEQDLICAVSSHTLEGDNNNNNNNNNDKVPTVAITLGGGVAVAVFQLLRSDSKGSWCRTASEPYLLPLASLSQSVSWNGNNTNSSSSSSSTPSKRSHTPTPHSTTHSTTTTTNHNTPRISHGFGDILSTTFLNTYTEPVLLLLHTNPHRHGGRACTGRMGHVMGGTRTPLSLTAVSMSVPQKRSVILWSLRDVLPSDAVSVISVPIGRGGGGRGGGALVVGVNEVVYVDCGGRIVCGCAVNGWVRATASSVLLSKHARNGEGGDATKSDGGGGILQPNPSPLPKLAMQLDASRISFVTDSVALVCLRDGSLYSLELHRGRNWKRGCGWNGRRGNASMCMSVSPLGYKLGALGMVSSLSILPLLRMSGTVDKQSLFQSKVMGTTGPSTLSNDKQADGQESNVKQDPVEPTKGGETDVSSSMFTSIGLVFAGSRLGDSSLLMYELREDVPLLPLELGDKVDGNHNQTEDGSSVRPSIKRKREEVENGGDEQDKVTKDTVHEPQKEQEMSETNDTMHAETNEPINKCQNGETNQEEAATTTTTTSQNDETQLTEEEILQQEEEALYAPPPNHDSTHIISDEDEDDEQQQPQTIPSQTSPTKTTTRPQLSSMSIFQPMKALDSLTGLGPLGPGCIGPIASILPHSHSGVSPGGDVPMAGGGCTTNIHPCGYGSSGGLAILTAPGLNYGSTILSEVDCRNVACVFGCARLGYVFLVREGENGGCIVMEMEEVDGGVDAVKKEVGEGVEGDGTSVVEERQLVEVDIGTWGTAVEKDVEVESEIPSFFNVRDVLTRMNIVTVKECQIPPEHTALPHLVAMVRYGSAYAIVVLSKSDNELSMVHTHMIGAQDYMDGLSSSVQRDDLRAVSTVDCLGMKQTLFHHESLSLACVWSSGHGSIFTVTCLGGGGGMESNGQWKVSETILDGNGNYGEETGNVSNEEVDEADETYQFYQSNKIVSMDIFTLPDDIFASIEKRNDEKKDHDERNAHDPPLKENSENEVMPVDNVYEFDADDLELYGDDVVNEIQMPESINEDPSESADMAPSRYNTLGGYVSGAELSMHSKVYVAVCRQSGALQILDVAKFIPPGEEFENYVQHLSSDSISEALVWEASGGCGLGVPLLRTGVTSSPQKPKFHEVCVAEIRVYFSGPSDTGTKSDLSILRSLCLVIETNLGDLLLYTGSRSSSNGSIQFKRVSLGVVARASKEESRHNTKLRRKGILSMEAANSEPATFRPNRLHRFFSISGQDGLFAATFRPLWFLSERGAPAVLCHRLRHAAPAGGRPLPVTGFCAGLNIYGDESEEFSFLTLHERIGRVGSQRITLYNGLSDVYTPHGLLPGGGVCVQKVPLGVTVRQVQFIDDASVSTAAHPLYVLLVSREILSDQSHLNDDGLTSMEKQMAKDEKEKEKTRRQVEADLGGFDIEQEWVEEIEREDCFEVEKKYGNAPPIINRVYEIWLIDAAGWNVVDTYQLEEFEHGLAMKVMPLSDIPEDPGPNVSTKASDKPPENTLFLTIGTGIVDNDGEDISSRGRIILFELKRTSDDGDEVTTAEINFVYDKDILLGPVTSLSCLSCENKNRLVVGAGAEITVEEWTQGKLTQVGFFHANMQVQEIVLFKTFFLLSDAYDSLHFLVWRESDKSLTLLAKDYEPTPVYAAGLLSRGGAVSFVCHDDRQNLQFFNYAPGDTAARGGNKLVCRADFHLGTQTIGLQSHFCRSSILINSATINSTLVALKKQDTFFGKVDDDQRFAIHYGSTDGGFGSLIPLNENMYWRFAALQSVMSNALESDCALSQRAWRLYRRSPRRGGCRSNDRKKGVIDGDLTVKYVDLPLSEQEDLASSIGSTVDLILDNLLEVACASMVI